MFNSSCLLTFNPVNPYLASIFFLIAWFIFLMIMAKSWASKTDPIIYAHRMHQIPCSHCQFFTANYQLKCTVHPIEALTEEAIHCPDYDPTQQASTSRLYSSYSPLKWTKKLETNEYQTD